MQQQQRPDTPTSGTRQPKLLADCQAKIFAEMRGELVAGVDFAALRPNLRQFRLLDDVTDGDDVTSGQIFGEIERRVDRNRDVIALLLVCLRRRHPAVVAEFDRRVFGLMRNLSNHVAFSRSSVSTSSSGRSSPYGGRRSWTGGPQQQNDSWTSSKSAYYSKASRYSPSPLRNETEVKKTKTNYNNPIKVDVHKQQQPKGRQQHKEAYEKKKQQQKLYEEKQQQQKQLQQEKQQQQLQRQHQLLQERLREEQQKQIEQEQLHKEQEEKQQQQQQETLYDKVQKQLQYNEEQQRQKQQEKQQQYELEQQKILEEQQQKQEEEKRKQQQQQTERKRHEEQQRQEEEQQQKRKQQQYEREQQQLKQAQWKEYEMEQQLQITEIEKDAELSESQEQDEDETTTNTSGEKLSDVISRSRVEMRRKSRKTSLSKIKRRLLPSLSEEQEEDNNKLETRLEPIAEKKAPESKRKATASPKPDRTVARSDTPVDDERRTTLDDVIGAVWEKFGKLVKRNETNTNRKQQSVKTIVQNFRQQLDLKLFVDELVRNCVISVRSAWLLRHTRGGGGARLVALCRLLAALTAADCCDVITRCDNTGALVRCVCKCRKDRKHFNQLLELFRDQTTTTAATTQERPLPEPTNDNDKKQQAENLRSKPQQQQKRTSRKTIDKPIRRSKLPQTPRSASATMMTSSPILTSPPQTLTAEGEDGDVSSISVTSSPSVITSPPRTDGDVIEVKATMAARMTSSSTCDLHGGQSEQQQEKQEEKSLFALECDRDLVPVEEWCRRNQLDAATSSALHRNDHTTMIRVREITEDEIEQLPGLSWRQKAKLWVALENGKLNEFYARSHDGLSDILKILHK